MNILASVWGVESDLRHLIVDYFDVADGLLKEVPHHGAIGEGDLLPYIVCFHQAMCKKKPAEQFDIGHDIAWFVDMLSCIYIVVDLPKPLEKVCPLDQVIATAHGLGFWCIEICFIEASNSLFGLRLFSF